MDILIKHQTKDGEIHFSTVESWKPTEDEAMIEAIRDFKIGRASCRERVSSPV